jgi:hypothetical protein
MMSSLDMTDDDTTTNQPLVNQIGDGTFYDDDDGPPCAGHPILVNSYMNGEYLRYRGLWLDENHHSGLDVHLPKYEDPYWLDIQYNNMTYLYDGILEAWVPIVNHPDVTLILCTVITPKPTNPTSKQTCIILPDERWLLRSHLVREQTIKSTSTNTSINISSSTSDSIKQWTISLYTMSTAVQEHGFASIRGRQLLDEIPIIVKGHYFTSHTTMVNDLCSVVIIPTKDPHKVECYIVPIVHVMNAFSNDTEHQASHSILPSKSKGKGQGKDKNKNKNKNQGKDKTQTQTQTQTNEIVSTSNKVLNNSPEDWNRHWLEIIYNGTLYLYSPTHKSDNNKSKEEKQAPQRDVYIALDKHPEVKRFKDGRRVRTTYLTKENMWHKTTYQVDKSPSVMIPDTNLTLLSRGLFDEC